MLARCARRATASCRGSRSCCASSCRRSDRRAGRASRAARRRSGRRCARSPSTRNATGSDGRSRSRGRRRAGRPCSSRSKPTIEGWKPKPLGGLEHVAIRDAELRPGAVVGRIAVRHDSIQPVVAAGQLDDDQDALGVLLDARALRAPAPRAPPTCGSRRAADRRRRRCRRVPRTRKSRREHEAAVNADESYGLSIPTDIPACSTRGRAARGAILPAFSPG